MTLPNLTKQALQKDHHVSRHLQHDVEKKHGEGSANWGGEREEIERGYEDIKEGVDHAQVQGNKVNVVSQEEFEKLKAAQQ